MPKTPIPEPHRRCTFYLRPSQARALKIRAAEADRDVSAFVRELLDTFLAKLPARRKGR